ncbi:capsular biosynthesis protein [Enterovibrio norvegicus FF-33]|uniref:Capsular biosynthesis protein n=1 Tax=Enterovibrio norvegicus FF-454 TaxID=1185651 RepID=A0A1E5C4P6_9GAMM|nr:ion transporter [Enterovibrio norvegicus]OEE60417.1 capsular biosynthesis protein [Enterovibrio norvegicus FF-454]OEE70892.1 capsular biosynthesis protein [Enterovibrio norvegicus FF-33]
MTETKTQNLDLNPMSLLSLLLSFVSLCVVSTLVLLPKSDPLYTLLLGVDTLICMIFLLQLSIHFLKSDNKLTYLKTHWIDILASIPVVEALRFARVFQIFRVIRLLKASEPLVFYMRKNRNETAMASILLLLTVLISAGSAAIFAFESTDNNANIDSLTDAIWWMFVTISTVGYGDHYPVTAAGRAVAVVVIVCGVGIFGAVTGLVASYITKPEKKEQEQAIRQSVVLETLLTQQQQMLTRLADMEARLNMLAPATPEQENIADKPTKK